MFPNLELQYLQTAALLTMQQKIQQALLPLQMQQTLFLANLMRQKEANELLRPEQNFRKISSYENYLQNQSQRYTSSFQVIYYSSLEDGHHQKTVH